MSDGLTSLSPQATIARIRELNETIISAAETVGTSYLEHYEQALSELADFQKQVNGANPIGWVTALATTQAKFIQQISSQFVAAARSALI
jgi:hypothetical protein